MRWLYLVFVIEFGIVFLSQKGRGGNGLVIDVPGLPGFTQNYSPIINLILLSPFFRFFHRNTSQYMVD